MMPSLKGAASGMPRPGEEASLSTQSSPAQSHSSARHAHRLRLDAFLHPLQELCPSRESVEALVEHLQELEEASRSGVEGSNGTDIRGSEQKRLLRTRISDALLRSASSGDMELLGWLAPRVCHEPLNMAWNDLRDDDGAGPVVLAASSSHAEAVRLLVSHGADVNERDASGWTPLMWAVNCSNLPLTSYLLSHGADAYAQTHKGATCEDFLLSVDPDLQQLPRRSSDGRTPRPSLGRSDSENAFEDRALIADLIFEHQQSVAEAPFVEGQSQDFRIPLSTSSTSAPSDAGESAFASTQELEASTPASSNLERSASSAASSLRSRQNTESATPRRRLIGHTERTERAERELRTRELAEGRRRALLDVAHLLGVEYRDLVGESETPLRPPTGKPRRSRGTDSHEAPAPSQTGLAVGCGAVEVGADPLSNEFCFDLVLPDQMLVFGEAQVDVLIKHIVHRARPVRAPWTRRAMPANVAFLCLRYACKYEDRDSFEDLLMAFVEGVEAVVNAHSTRMTDLAFWLYNGVLLLHYLRHDTATRAFEEDGEYSSTISVLINQIYMLIIRDTERRIDRILDAAVLDLAAFEEVDDIRYEDEWSFMRTLKGSVKGLSSLNGSPQTSPAKAMTSNRRKPLDQIFSASSIADSPLQSPTKAKTTTASPATFTTSGLSTLAAPSDPSVDNLLAQPSPRTITALLTAVLHILQLYEINPAIILQALSQVFYWVGCETFNRILTQRKYLCKARVMHIRLNLSAIEDWIKTNALPMAIARKHFAPVHQLISWVLCQSSLGDFDGLISTMQGLKLLNPAQLRRVVRDYRYEVGEPHMNEEGQKYLEQLQRDWERSEGVERRQRQQSESMQRARQLGADRHSRHASESGVWHSRGGTATQDDPDPDPPEQFGKSNFQQRRRDTASLGSEASGEGGDSFPDLSSATIMPGNDSESIEEAVQEAIDGLFAPGSTIADYEPVDPPAPSSGPIGSKPDYEHLKSRDMLPFVLPSDTAHLIVSPGDAFGFGRGHFMGTGTPSLKNMRSVDDEPRLQHAADARSPSHASSPVHRPRSVFSAAASQTSLQRLGLQAEDLHAALDDITRGSPNDVLCTEAKVKGLQPSLMNSSREHSTSNGFGNLSTPPTLSVDGSTDVDDAGSVTSSTRIAELYPQGKGLAAGASWQPVPLLPEGTLEELARIMMAGATSTSVESRATN